MQRKISINKPNFKSANFIIFFLFIQFISFAQTGSIKGTVKDSENGEVIVGANVAIEGTKTGTITDFDGNFTLPDLKPGKYILIINFISYEQYKSGEIELSEGSNHVIEVSLKSTSISLTTVNVSATRKTSNDVAVINTIKGSVGVSNGISGQLISKTQDKDAADVVKRIPGITIIDDKFIIVRGLSQRYNSVWLNNAATPSSEADNKAFSFDVIPSSMIDNVMVYKTAQADYPADYTGGFIKITTKAIPDQNSLQFSYSLGFNEGTTFKDFYRYDGSKTDWLGFDNGFRALPKEMPANLQEYNSADNPVFKERALQIARSMNKSWVPKLHTAIPDQRFLIGISRKFNLGKSSFGNYTAITYGNSYDYNKIDKNNTYNIYGFGTDNISPLDEFQDHQYTNTAKIGLIHNWAFNLNENNKIEFRNLLNQIGYTRTATRNGLEWYSLDSIKSTDLSFVSRSMYSGQLSGNHSIRNENTKIDWTLGYSISNKNEPDHKMYKYSKSVAQDSYEITFPSSGSSPQSHIWSKLNENLLSGALNFNQKLSFSDFNPEFKIGLYYEKKSRDFSLREFDYASTGSTFINTSLSADQIFTNENFNLTDGIKMVEFISKSNSYSAGTELIASYAMVKIPIRKFDLNFGIRVERSNQFLNSYLTNSSIPVNPKRDTLNFFPSLNLIYNITENSLFRFAYGKTVNRAEFREMAPFFFWDFGLNAALVGDPDIKPAYINNYDLRYEFYPSPNELVTLGAFYKEMTDAIEFIIIGTSPTIYSFTNVETSSIYGIEAEFKKDLAFIGLKNFSASFNGSIIKSSIQSGINQLTRNRPLQGQSPYIINAGLYYQNEKNGLSATVVYNIIGKRIVAVGIPKPNQWEDIPDIYETPRNLLDLTISKKLGKYFELKLGIKDLINQKIEYTQNVNTDVDMSIYGGSGIKHYNRNQITKLYYPGRSFSIGISLKI